MVRPDALGVLPVRELRVSHQRLRDDLALLLAVEVAPVEVEAAGEGALARLVEVACRVARARQTEAVSDLLAVVPVDDRAVLIDNDRHLNAVLADRLLERRVLVIREAG